GGAGNPGACRFGSWKCLRDPKAPVRRVDLAPTATGGWQSCAAGCGGVHARADRRVWPGRPAASVRYGAKFCCLSHPETVPPQHRRLSALRPPVQGDASTTALARRWPCGRAARCGICRPCPGRWLPPTPDRSSCGFGSLACACGVGRGSPVQPDADRWNTEPRTWLGRATRWRWWAEAVRCGPAATAPGRQRALLAASVRPWAPSRFPRDWRPGPRGAPTTHKNRAMPTACEPDCAGDVPLRADAPPPVAHGLPPPVPGVGCLWWSTTAEDRVDSPQAYVGNTASGHRAVPAIRPWETVACPYLETAESGRVGHGEIG